MRSIQEQEHLDFLAGSDTEFRNCFSEANMVRRQLAADYRRPIDAALEAGKFVVVDEEPYYCKATDAVAGMVEYLRGVFDTREEADAFALNLFAQEGQFSDGRIYVLPAAPPTVREEALAALVPDNDIPF